MLFVTMSSAPEKVQINLRLNADLAARLENLSATYNKRGRLHVAEEILEQCVEIYEQSEKAKYNVLRSYCANNRSDAEDGQ